MSRSRSTLGIIAVFFMLGLVACQKRQQPIQLQPPLLPPVPSRQQTELLTRQQLSFIRHHQNKQQLDKVNYSPYLCLPKYLCVVDDEDGEKRTTIVNGLHPALREPSLSMAQEEDAVFLPVPVPKLSIKNVPNSKANYEERANDDEFLWDQEINEQVALEQQQRQAFLDYQKEEPQESNEREESAEADSGESTEDGDDNKSAYDGSPEDNRKEESSLYNKNTDSFESTLKDVDNLTEHVATVPWDDRPKNKSDATLRDRIKSVLPSMPKIPFLSKNRRNPGTTTTQRSILRRMLGGRRNFFGSRSKRDTDQARKSGNPFMTKLGTDIKTSDQCRVLYNGCNLNYEQIMEIATNKHVLIEGDEPKTTTEKQQSDLGLKAEDDEADQAIRDFPKKRRPLGNKSKKPFQVQKQKPGFGFKVKGSKYGNSQSPFNQIKPKTKPGQGMLENDESDPLSVPSLPILPMRFTWGRPNFYKGRPPYPNIFDDLDSRRPTQPPTPPPPSTPPPPVFVGNPVYKKVNRTGTTTNVVALNSTHALQIILPSSKPFRPMKTSVHDKDGRPSSFASVFTEIAGTSGGLHDFFDKIANTVGHQPHKRRAQKQISAPAQARSSKLPTYRIKSRINNKKKKDEEQEDESKSEEDDEEQNEGDDESSTQKDDSEEDEEVNEEEVVTKNDDQEQEDAVGDDESNKNDESNEDEEEEVAEEEVVTKNDDKKQEDAVADDETNKNDESNEDEDEEVAEEEVVTKNDDKKQEDAVADDETNKNDESNEDEDEELAEEEVVTKNDDQEQEDTVADNETNKNDESNEDDDEDKKKDEVDLPEDLPAHIREAILEDIRTGGKKNKDGPDEPQKHEVEAPGQGQGHGQGPPEGQGYNQQRPGPSPHYQQQAYRPGPNRPPPRRGLFRPFF